jgi:hypothetical protein
MIALINFFDFTTVQETGSRGRGRKERRRR